MAKILNRVLGAAGVAILVSSLGVLAACSTNADEENTGSGAQAVSNANVSIVLYDENGVQTGTGSGVLIAPQTVLTAAHLVAGKGKWTVTSADGKSKVNGVAGQTFDWKRYDSLMAHPRKHDVAVIFLDRPIHLASYPKIATLSQATGEKVMRVTNSTGNFQFVGGSLDRVRQMPNAYTLDMPANETLDTGGAVVNGKGEIVGVVTGRGMQTGKLYVAKLGEVVGWLSGKAECGGESSALSVRTYGVPAPKPGCTKDGGAAGSTSSSSGSTSSSSGSTSSGGSSSGASGSSSGASGSSGSSGASGGLPGGKCETGGGYDYPGGGGSQGVSLPTGLSNGGESGTLPGGDTGGTGGTSSGGTSSGGTTGGAAGGSSGSNTGGETGTLPGGNTGGTGGTSSGGTSSGGSTGGAGSGSATGSESGNLPSGTGGGAGGSAGADEEVCEGENDNPDVCPPETINCEGPSCGGAKAPGDNTIDYGNCGCKPSGGGTGAIILH